MCDSSEHLTDGHGNNTAGVDVTLHPEEVDLCAEHAIAYLTWQLDGCPDPEEHEEFAQWCPPDDLRQRKRRSADKRRPQRLTKPQRALLAEIGVVGTLYIRRVSPYWRTVQALSRRGLVVCSEPDYTRTAMDGWSLTGEDSDV